MMIINLKKSKLSVIIYKHCVDMIKSIDVKSINSKEAKNQKNYEYNCLSFKVQTI